MSSRASRFFSQVIPAIGSMVVTAVYYIVDGVFVGRGVGADALACINLAVPFLSILVSVTMMISMGGATISSIFFGRNEHEKANDVFSLSFVMVIVFAIFMMIISHLWSENIARLMGASAHLVEDTAVYVRNYITFGIFFATSLTLSTFVRNDGRPKLAFMAMVSGAVSNIFLDWLFIFPLQMGVKGAAIASGLGQVLSCLILMTHFLSKRGFLTFRLPKFDFSMMRRICLIGVPEFVTQMSQGITIWCYNIIVYAVYGDIGVAAFSVASYIFYIVLYFFMGTGQGIQPLISLSYGMENYDDERYYLRLGLLLNIVASFAIYAIMFFFGRSIIKIFNADLELIEITYSCLLFYGMSFVFASVNIVFTTYHLATERTINAFLITLFRGVLINSVFIFLMPYLFGRSFVWSGIVVAELVVMLFSVFVTYRRRKI